MSITIRVHVTGFEVFSQREAVSELRLAAIHAAQSKLHVRRALAVLPGDQPRLRSVFEALARWLQLVVEAMHKIPRVRMTSEVDRDE